MWLSKRAFLLGGSASLLAGCGFAPVYGPGNETQDLRGLILADAPNDRKGFDFVGQFERRLGRTGQPTYLLSYSISTNAQGVGVTPSGDTTRVNLFGAVTFKLVDAASKAEITSGFVESFTAYSATQLIVSTQTVQRQAQERLMVILADKVVDRLITTASDWRV